MTKKTTEDENYDIEPIRKVDAEYKALLGERANGKSFAVKLLCLKEAFKNGNTFIYLRRWETDIKAEMVKGYFEDLIENDDNINYIEKMTKKEYDNLSVYNRNIYFAKTDESGKIKRGIKCASVIYLTGVEHFKSMQYPRTTNIIFEEFVTKEGYLNEEPHKLMSLVSTVFRRRKGTVWLIGNTISRVCPYFCEWQLKHVLTQKEGTIDIYKQKKPDGSYKKDEDMYVTIAVEMCKSVAKENKMFFGHKSTAIVSGKWENDIQPKLQKDYKIYEKLYYVKLEYNEFTFTMVVIKDPETNFLELYVYPNTKRDRIKRIVTDKYNADPLITPKLNIITRGDSIVKQLVQNKKVVFSDNLTGSDFWYILKLRGGL